MNWLSHKDTILGYLHVSRVGSFKEEEGKQKSRFKVRDRSDTSLLTSVKME